VAPAHLALLLPPSGVGDDCFASRSPRVTRVLLLWDLAPAAGWWQSPPGPFRPLPLGDIVMPARQKIRYGSARAAFEPSWLNDPLVLL